MSQLESINPVRNNSRDVMERSEHVEVNEDLIPEFCDHITSKYEFETADWDAPVFPTVDEHGVEDVTDFLFVGNALNYCFNDMESGDKFTYEFIDTKWSGAFGMWAGLMDEYQDNPDLLNPQYLQSITTEEVERIFEASNNVPLPMPKSRAENLRSVGELMSDFGGSFWNAFSMGTVQLYGENGVVSNLAGSESYKDERTYDGEKVRFDKRAQLSVSMLYGKLLDTEHAFEISDMEEFTVFADYGIPAGLATHGVINYSDELTSRIQNCEIIEENSKEEIEIRSATVVAGELIQDHLEENYDVDATIPVLDYVLWRMRKDADTNVHLTKTTAY